MGFIKAVTDSIGGTFADQWKEIITVQAFDEHTAVSPGILQENNNGRGVNNKGSVGVISNGSKILSQRIQPLLSLANPESRKSLLNQVDTNTKMEKIVSLMVTE